jgi:hypothetical protein
VRGALKGVFAGADQLGNEEREERTSVDAAGAATLRWRIEQQQHWRQAQAVLDGRQPSVDPHMEELVSVGEGIRIYDERHGSGRRLRLCKRLVDGVWENGSLDDEAELGSTLARDAAEQVARVA